MKGTPAFLDPIIYQNYMSENQESHAPFDIYKADIYSLGIALFAVATTTSRKVTKIIKALPAKFKKLEFVLSKYFGSPLSQSIPFKEQVVNIRRLLKNRPGDTLK